MSYRRSTQFHTRRQNSSECRFCKENGHTVDKCTVLANTECNYCHEIGHTTRRCQKLADKEIHRKSKARAARAIEFAPNADGFAKAKGTFRRVSKDAEGCRLKLLTTFAAFETGDIEPKKRESVSYARPAVAEAKPVKGVWSKPVAAVVTEITLKPEKKPRVAVQSTVPKMKRIRIIGSWADAADDESGEESDDKSL